MEEILEYTNKLFCKTVKRFLQFFRLLHDFVELLKRHWRHNWSCLRWRQTGIQLLINIIFMFTLIHDLKTKQIKNNLSLTTFDVNSVPILKVARFSVQCRIRLQIICLVALKWCHRMYPNLDTSLYRITFLLVTLDSWPLAITYQV